MTRNNMEQNILVQLIGSLGFPIAVAVWFMVKSSKDTQMTCECLRELKEAILVLQEKVSNK